MTGFVGLDRARMLDVVPGRSGHAVEGWLGGRAKDRVAGIDTLAFDPFRGYGAAQRYG